MNATTVLCLLGLVATNVASGSRQKRHTYVLEELPHKDSVVNYYYAEPDHFTASEKDIMKRAMNEIMNISCVEFKEVDPKKHDGFATKLIMSEETDSCGEVQTMEAIDFSNVATPWDMLTKVSLIYEMESLTIFKQCATSYETYVHELFHVLGFLHENRRDDWESHVKYGEFAHVYDGQVSPPTSHEDRLFGRTHETPFDAASIMTYDVEALVNVTFMNAPKMFIDEVGFSKLDIYRLNSLYKCPKFDEDVPLPHEIVEYKFKPCMDATPDSCSNHGLGDETLFCNGTKLREGYGINGGVYTYSKEATIDTMKHQCPVTCGFCEPTYEQI